MKIHLFDRDQKTETLPAGATVFQEGDMGEEMFAVLEGAVEIRVRGKPAATMEAGDVFGEMAIVEQQPRTATAVVTQDAKLVRIDKRRFMFLVQQNPYFAVQLMGIMANRLRRANERL